MTGRSGGRAEQPPVDEPHRKKRKARSDPGFFMSLDERFQEGVNGGLIDSALAEDIGHKGLIVIVFFVEFHAVGSSRFLPNLDADGFRFENVSQLLQLINESCSRNHFQSLALGTMERRI
jgi:hypothetical protein